MKMNGLIIGALVVVLLGGAGFYMMNSRGNSNEISRMARSGAKEDELLSIVQKSSGKYNLSDSDILALKKDGVSDDVIIAMLRHNRAEVAGAAPSAAK